MSTICARDSHGDKVAIYSLSVQLLQICLSLLSAALEQSLLLCQLGLMSALGLRQTLLPSVGRAAKLRHLAAELGFDHFTEVLLLLL